MRSLLTITTTTIASLLLATVPAQAQNIMNQRAAREFEYSTRQGVYAFCSARAEGKTVRNAVSRGYDLFMFSLAQGFNVPIAEVEDYFLLDQSEGLRQIYTDATVDYIINTCPEHLPTQYEQNRYNY